jgi:hypothetical protein
MPGNDGISRTKARRKARKVPSTPVGEFVGEEIELIRRGVGGAPSTSQATATGMSHGYRYISSILLAVAL